MIVDWDSDYEAIPTSGLSRNYIDDVLREVRFAIRERMEIEHEWGPFSSQDNGTHRLGLTSVADVGSTCPSGAREGSLYLRTDGGDLRLFLYYSGSWQAITSIDHLNLTNRSSATAHSQYLLLNAGELTGNLDMGGYHLHTGAASTEQQFAGVLLYRHKGQSHPTFGDPSMIPTLTVAHLDVGWSRVSDSLADNDYIVIYGPTDRAGLFPEVHVAATATETINFITTPGGFALLNNSGGAVDYRIGRILL